METTCRSHGSRGVGVCNANRQFHLAEQRPQALDLPGLFGVEPAEGDVADLPAHVLVVVTR
jgi:hypothetical protein